MRAKTNHNRLLELQEFGGGQRRETERVMGISDSALFGDARIARRASFAILDRSGERYEWNA
jgi:hypothetical protein